MSLTREDQNDLEQLTEQWMENPSSLTPEQDLRLKRLENIVTSFRAAVRNDPTCNICCRPYDSPFRSRDEEGNIVMGCVDSCHGAHLPSDSDDWKWHYREAAVAVRMNLLLGKD